MVDLHSPVDDFNLANCQINKECRHPRILYILRNATEKMICALTLMETFGIQKDLNNEDRRALRSDGRSPISASLISLAMKLYTGKQRGNDHHPNSLMFYTNSSRSLLRLC